MNGKSIKRHVRNLRNQIIREATGSTPTQNRLQKNAKKMSVVMTEPERLFAMLLKQLDVKFETQKIVGRKIFDFYIPGKNMLVEVDGGWFHSDARVVKENNMNRMQKKNKKNDIYKDKLALTNGYKIERVWEFDLKNNYDEVKKRIKGLLINE